MNIKVDGVTWPVLTKSGGKCCWQTCDELVEVITKLNQFHPHYKGSHVYNSTGKFAYEYYGYCPEHAAPHLQIKPGYSVPLMNFITDEA